MGDYVYFGYTIVLMPSIFVLGYHNWQVWHGEAGVGPMVDHGSTFGPGNARRDAEEVARQHRDRMLQAEQELPVTFVPKKYGTWTLERILIDAGLEEPGETV